MIKGLYTAASGMMTLLSANDNIANNLANINTPGFKKGIAIFKSFAPMLIDKISADGNEKDVSGGRIGSFSSGCELSAVGVDFSQGQIKKTDNKYDCALQGSGFFKVQTPTGKIAYTRDGCFQRSTDGYLVTRDGNFVLGTDNRKIRMEDNVINFQIANDGTIWQDDLIVGEEQVLGKLNIVDFENKHGLLRQGNNLYIDPGTAKPKEATGCRVIQGAVESSNANVIRTMTQSIEGMRAYETLAKIVGTTGDNLQKTVSQLGKV